LFPNDEAWQAALPELEACIDEFESFKGKLGESPSILAACLDHDVKTDRIAERIGTYAFLKTTEDQSNSVYQGFAARYQSIASRAGQAASFIRPEILGIADETMQKWLETEVLAPYRLVLQRIHRYRAHTLSQNEERLLAMQSEMAQSASKAFRQLNDADLKFGSIEVEKDTRFEAISLDLTDSR
jgi:oligoendopeptidase F